MITKEQFSDLLDELNACIEAKKWFASFDGTLEEAWIKCERGEWMLWLLTKLQADQKKMILTACGCARLSLKYVPYGENRPLKAIETAESWVKEKATLEEVNDAATAARAAATAAATAAARAAAWAAAWAANATNATNAARAAAWAANAATAAANAAAWAANAATFKQCAEIAREQFSYNEIISLIEIYSGDKK